MHDYIEKEEFRGYTIKLYIDDEAPDPREWSEYTSNMITFHKNYTIGDRHDWEVTPFKSWLSRNQDNIIQLPVYMYDHSGITISTEPFSCPWDSGQIGVIYETKKSIREEFGVKRVTNKLIKTIEDRLRLEVDEYDHYCTGQIFSYTVENPQGDVIESCGNWYDENEAICDAKHSINYDIEQLVEVRTAEACA